MKNPIKHVDYKTVKMCKIYQSVKNNKATILAFAVLFLCSHTVWAQKAVVTLEPREILIGQHASLHIRIELPSKASLIYPALLDTITRQIEIVRFGRPDTLSIDTIPFVLEQVHTITSWEAGFHPIPSFDFIAIAGQDTIMFKSDALLLEVQTVEVQSDEDIRDIKTILGIPITFRDIIPYLAGLLVLGAIAWLLIRYMTKPRIDEQKPPVWKQPDIPAHMAAFSSLSGLKNKKLWQAGKYKLYHSELSNILRFYLEKRYGIGAMEMTTSEIMLVIEPLIDDPVNLNNLRQILEVADLVKFAKFNPEASLNESSMELAFDFVDGTKKVVKDAG
jgi:hypothetical protein